MSSLGEIDINLHRNGWQVRFHAIVTKDLHCDFVAGNNFFKENKVSQNISSGTITVHNKYTIPETNKSIILSTLPANKLIKNNSMKIVLPGQTVSYAVPHREGQNITVEPWFRNKVTYWPTPQICQVRNGHIQLTNDMLEPIDLKNDVPSTSQNNI